MDASLALKISREVAKAVRDSVLPVAGTVEAGENIGMGKDGTPTKKIDRLAEDAAIEVLKEWNLKVVTEESGIVGSGDTVVALDPVDGTFNAARGIPIYSVSLCFAESKNGTAKYKDTFFGYVYNIATGDEYYADEFAYKNRRKIKVTETESIEKTNAIMYYPLKNYGFKRIRIFGAASLEICFVADGTVDCFIDIRRGAGRGMLRVYDVVAGLYIAEKAGAVVTTPKGKSIKYKEFTMDERFKIVVANKNLHRKIIDILN
ncbi:MAG: inositol monophosphatase [Archaeoglobus sp.]|jgi:myo-inositol-1(or 4)-monophosphatase|nr:MAG: inositol monophosphatase [Archaeoglobus sp.]